MFKRVTPSLNLVQIFLMFFLVLLAVTCLNGVVLAVDPHPLPTIGIYNPPETGTSKLVSLFDTGEFAVSVLDDHDLLNLTDHDLSMLVIPPGSRFPIDARQALSAYMWDRGNLMVLEPRAFDYAPECTDPKLLSDLREGGRDYRLIAPNTDGRTIEWVDTPEVPGSSTVHVYTPHVGAGDILFDIPIPERSADRYVICFSAKGGYNVDIMYLRLIDLTGQSWIAHVELDRDWRTYAVSMADFLPLGKALQASGALVDPATVARLSIGMARYVVWPERDGSFALGPVSIGSAPVAQYTPTSELTKWRVQLERFDVAFPEWIIDPFLGTSPVQEDATVRTIGLEGSGTPEAKALWQVPPPLAERGREATGLDEVLLSRHDLKRMPLLEAVDSSGQSLATVAEVRTFNSGYYKGSSVALFGLSGIDYEADTPAGDMLLNTARYLLLTPQIQRVTVKTLRDFINPLDLVLDIRVTNPLDWDVEGEVVVSVAEDTLQAVVPVRLPADTTDIVTVRLGQVPDTFPFHDFEWTVEVRTDHGNDSLSDHVNAERILIQAAKHMLAMQREHVDGRMSHHFFADIYGARALLALGRYLQDPAVVDRHRDILDGLRAEDFTSAALRFTDMVVARQRDDGAFPMGYGEHRDIIYIADLGSIALGLVQMASWLDEPRKSEYLDAVSHYFDLRETFYIDEDRARELQEEYGVNDRGVIKGTYGLGFLGSDYFVGGTWPETRREPRGPWWVLPVSMGFSGGMALLDQGEQFADVALRDATEYLESKYSAEGYFHSEGVFWLYYALPDPELRSRLLRLVETTALPAIMTTKEHDWFEVGGRAALRWLSPMYYRNFFADTADVRAGIVKALWEIGSESSSLSIKEVTSRFPRTIYGPSNDAYRYAAYSAIWLIEMLDPGSTLLQGIELGR